MNRRNFFKGLVGSVAAIAAAPLLPQAGAKPKPKLYWPGTNVPRDQPMPACYCATHNRPGSWCFERGEMCAAAIREAERRLRLVADDVTPSESWCWTHHQPLWRCEPLCQAAHSLARRAARTMNELLHNPDVVRQLAEESLRFNHEEFHRLLSEPFKCYPFRSGSGERAAG